MLLAFLLGAVSAFALPPAYATPFLWLVYPILLWQVQAARTYRQAFAAGWAFGFGQFVFGLYWLTFSLFTDIGRWWWAVPFASTILPALLAFIPGLALTLLWRMRVRGLAAVIGLAAWLTLGEWVRGHILTGFPWNLTGHGWIGWPAILQSYSFLGAYALGFLTIAACSSPALLADSAYPRRRAAAICVAGFAIFGLLGIWGAGRLSHAPAESSAGAIVRLVQPNVPENEKWSDSLAQSHFQTLLSLTEQPGKRGRPKVFVWPEAAVPWPLDLAPSIPHAIGSAIRPGEYVLTGVLRRDRVHGKWRYYNSLEAINALGIRVAHYDKAHLAPFGEYMPLRDVLPLDALATGDEDLAAGPGALTMDLPGITPFGPMICYEAIFSQTAVDRAHRPDWLLQITNDAWFGKTAGPHQHFAQAQARAVEQGLPLLRAANTGISGAVDGYGRILATLPLETQGFLDVALPAPLASQPFYGHHGDIIFFALEGAAFVFLVLATKRNR